MGLGIKGLAYQPRRVFSILSQEDATERTMKSSLALTFVFCITVAAQATQVEYIFGDDDEFYNSTSRDQRVFPFVAVVRLPDEICGTDSMTQGICRTKKQCQQQGGTTIGSVTCGGGYGVCCQYQMNCSSGSNGLTVTTSGTHITNPTLSNGMSASSCQITFRRPSQDICQVRLDFVDFNLNGPNADGDCDTDFMTISGADNLGQFVTCGQNDGQHLYLDYGTADTITASVTLNNLASTYDMMATYIRCNDCSSSSQKTVRQKKTFKMKGSTSSSNNNQGSVTTIEKAPPGCTQYLTNPSGEIRSFNYMNASGSATAQQDQINNEMYTVCIKSPPGATMITWTSCSNSSFCISGVDGGPGNMGNDCTQDWVDIPGSQAGRYCGCMFPTSVTSSSKPFSLYVKFNENEFPAPSMTDPRTGCPVGWECQDEFGFPVPMPVTPLCNTPEAMAMGWQCQAPAFFSDLIDIDNRGFCLRYMVS